MPTTRRNFIVWQEGAGTVDQHSSYEEARARAADRARVFPGVMVSVYEKVTSFSSGGLYEYEVVDFDIDDIPF